MYYNEELCAEIKGTMRYNDTRIAEKAETYFSPIVQAAQEQ